MDRLMVGDAHLDKRAPLARPDRLVGEGNESDLAAGSCNVLIWKGKQVGLRLRTPKGKKILSVAPGRRNTRPECLETTLGGVSRYRLPLPVRLANRPSLRA